MTFTPHGKHLIAGEWVGSDDTFRNEPAQGPADRFSMGTVELVDRCYKNVEVRLAPERLMIGDEQLNPENVPHLEAVSTEIVLPREAMGFGDVKFMAAIGAFLGWEATLFSLMVSSIIGSLVGVTLIVSGKREWSSRLPYGPYIAVAAVIWVFGGGRLLEMIFGR